MALRLRWFIYTTRKNEVWVRVNSLLIELEQPEQLIFLYFHLDLLAIPIRVVPSQPLLGGFLEQMLLPGQTHLNRRGARTKEDAEQVVMAPTALEPLGFDAHPKCPLGLEQVEGYVTQHREVLSRVVGTRAVVVLSESYVQNP